MLAIDTKCLTKDAKNIWRPATVVDILENDQYQVMFDSSTLETVPMESIIPAPSYANDGDWSGSDSDFNDGEVDLTILRSDDEDSEDELPVYLWRPNQTTDCLAMWEAHTKVILLLVIITLVLLLLAVFNCSYLDIFMVLVFVCHHDRVSARN